MKVSFAKDNDFAAAVRAGVRDALLDPGFRAALCEHVAETAAKYVWLTRKEVADMLGGRNEKTVARWAKKNLLKVNDKLGVKEPLYSLASVQEALESGAIRARSVRAAKKPAGTKGQPTSVAPRRTVAIMQN